MRPVVLLHGLLNWHPYGLHFVRTLAQALPERCILLVYTDECTRTWRWRAAGRNVLGCGRNWPYFPGRHSAFVQAARVRQKLNLIQQQLGLENPIDIIGHSMGGLIGRLVAGSEPGRVRHLVTIATPHHGTPLADEYLALTRALGFAAAVAELTPDAMAQFNREHPLDGLDLAHQGQVFTLRGSCDGGLQNWGTLGEVWAGFHLLRRRHKIPSDGLVPHTSAVILGARHLGDFPYDHRQLVRNSRVASCIAQILRSDS
ncbi:MAG: alpha/beta fold hydrolase [Alicyclobacillus herbarius]|uniref:lipase family alpha/beta hydrolase n=1 Tax=Alicyclobacillus herbarius TaxID=122960 RepID=UPI002357FD7D|nr:alpha/beta fold hydrolase [Alicyclobacillus herbarius]MCL6632775.1 alpha/beta fold hydrolase [Alicyclobacillus herbarius]